MNDQSLVIYQAENGAIELSVDAGNDTIWATQKQIAAVFDVNVRTVNEHLINIFEDGELQRDAVIRKLRITASDGKTYNTNHYNLDAIISTGYRINSRNATAFRKWATRTLRSYISDGYAINPARIEHGKSQFFRALEDLKLLSRDARAVGSGEATDLAMAFASTWFSLDAYDKSDFPTTGTIERAVDVGAGDLMAEIEKLKTQLVAKGEATELFATERDRNGMRSLFGNVFQSFDGHAVYPTVEEKAAQLLYFVVKNHVFIDGNKRSGAFAFVWFLQKSGLLDTREISPQALTAITLLVAESDPAEKDRMIGLVLMLLGVSKV